MSEVGWVLLLTLGAGIAIPIGAGVGCLERIQPRWLEDEFRHSVIAFGGGALLSAVAFVLVPDGIERVNPATAALSLCSGGLAFLSLDILLYKFQTPASQLAAMLSDFLPEALALGAAFASGSGGSAFLLAGLMALQNLPEGFNAYRELRDASPIGSVKIVTVFSLIAFLGPLAGLVGYVWLADFPVVVASIMLFASGGILYSIFQDIAPQAKLSSDWAPPMGAVFGFVLGTVGHMLVM